MGKDKDFIFRLRRLQAGLVEKDFAAKCGLKPATLRKYLTGERYPVAKNLELIATAHNVSLEWLISGKLPSGKEMTDEQLRAYFALDPEVIDIEEHERGPHPVVRAYDDLVSHLYFYCIHCMTFHKHGRGGSDYPHSLGRGGMAGDRGVHCLASNSPFWRLGVILDVVGTDKDHQEKYKKHAPLICPNCREYYSGAFNACSCGYINNHRKTLFPDLQQTYQDSYLLNTTEKPTGFTAPVDYVSTNQDNISLPPGVGLPGKNSKLERWHLVPLFGNVPAGFPSQINEPDIISYVAADMDVPKGAAAIRVSGNSMLKPDGDGIKDGDLVFFMEGQQAVHNSVVVVNDEFGDSMLKRLKIQEDGKYWLVSDNPAYPPVQPNCQFRIMGVVVKVRRNVKF